MYIDQARPIVQHDVLFENTAKCQLRIDEPASTVFIWWLCLTLCCLLLSFLIPLTRYLMFTYFTFRVEPEKDCVLGNLFSVFPSSFGYWSFHGKDVHTVLEFLVVTWHSASHLINNAKMDIGHVRLIIWWMSITLLGPVLQPIRMRWP